MIKGVAAFTNNSENNSIIGLVDPNCILKIPDN